MSNAFGSPSFKNNKGNKIKLVDREQLSLINSKAYPLEDFNACNIMNARDTINKSFDTKNIFLGPNSEGLSDISQFAN